MKKDFDLSMQTICAGGKWTVQLNAWVDTQRAADMLIKTLEIAKSLLAENDDAPLTPTEHDREPK